MNSGRKQRGRTAPSRGAGCGRGFVPVEELIELRNKLYEADAITMNGLHTINELIAKYEVNK